jgi:hypothetical protein
MGVQGKLMRCSHCNVCKTLSGSTYTMNQIIPKANFKLTKGGEALKSFTYHGESGEWPRSYGSSIPHCLLALHPPVPRPTISCF